jgi:hypothetical protein
MSAGQLSRHPMLVYVNVAMLTSPQQTCPLEQSSSPSHSAPTRRLHVHMPEASALASNGVGEVGPKSLGDMPPWLASMATPSGSISESGRGSSRSSSASHAETATKAPRTNRKSIVNVVTRSNLPLAVSP